MDLFEKINRSFGTWYEGLFGGGDDVRPKDILRKILAALEDNRKEGFDNRVYVPNQYILEISVADDEEKEYLLSFLDRDELESAIRRYCQQNHYHIRGSLDFTIKEADPANPGIARTDEKVRIRCRYNSKITSPEPAAAAQNEQIGRQEEVPYEERTVAGLSAYGADGDDGGTVPAVAAAAMMIYAPNRAPYRYTISQGAVTLGRSPRSGNDIVIETDGQISKKHARIEMDRDGQFTIYDLESTNGTRVNGRRIDNRLLHDGDEIVIGVTRLMFQLIGVLSDDAFSQPAPPPSHSNGAFGGAAAQFNLGGESGSSLPPTRALRSRNARLILMDGGTDIDSFLLASETLIGRGVTNDIVLPDRSIATRHARIVHDGNGYNLEPLDRSVSTSINGKTISPDDEVSLKDGDMLDFGSLHLRFEGGA